MGAGTHLPGGKNGAEGARKGGKRAKFGQIQQKSLPDPTRHGYCLTIIQRTGLIAVPM
jgi:hypothetical protein